MNNELKLMLQSVIATALEPIRNELQTLNQRILNVEENMAINQDLTDMRVQMNSRFDSLDAEVYLVKQDVAPIKTNVTLLASETPQDVMGMLKQINAKLDTQQVLSGKVSDLETDVKLIKKAITSQ